MPFLFTPTPVSQLRIMWARKRDELQALKYHEQAEALLEGVEAHYEFAINSGALPRSYSATYSNWAMLEAVWELVAPVLRQLGYSPFKVVAHGTDGADKGGEITVSATLE
jgi:hypothetical protein